MAVFGAPKLISVKAVLLMMFLMEVDNGAHSSLTHSPPPLTLLSSCWYCGAPEGKNTILTLRALKSAQRARVLFTLLVVGKIAVDDG